MNQGYSTNDRLDAYLCKVGMTGEPTPVSTNLRELKTETVEKLELTGGDGGEAE